MIPNTFTQQGKPPIFIQYAPAEEYNLEKFYLYTYGICASSENPDDIYDIVNPNSYLLLQKAATYVESEKIISLHYFDSELQNSEYLVAILLMMI